MKEGSPWDRLGPALIVVAVAGVAIFATLQSGCSDDCENTRGGCRAEPEDEAARPPPLPTR